MCESCESQFQEMAPRFDAVLKDYVKECEDGKLRDTPGLRVHDSTMFFRALCLAQGHQGVLVLSWYLGIAMERLASLERSGVPT